MEKPSLTAMAATVTSPLHRLQEHFGNRKQTVNDFLQKEQIQIAEYKPTGELHTILSTMVDNFQQL